jgi:hypothetical protein
MAMGKLSAWCHICIEISAVTGLVNKAAGITTMSSLSLPDVMVKKFWLPLTDQTAPGWQFLAQRVLLAKPDPKIVSVTSELPAVALVGEIELIKSSVELVTAMTSKVAEGDLERGSDPMGSPVSTATLAVTGLANRSAGITAVSFVLLTKVVVNRVSLPLTDHTTSLLLCALPTKVNPPMAVTVKVRSVLPATALNGEIEIEGGGGGPVDLEPIEPQPSRPIIRMRSHRDAFLLVFITFSWPEGRNGAKIATARRSSRSGSRKWNQRLTTFSQGPSGPRDNTSMRLEFAGLICQLMREIAGKNCNVED